jgi:hypothetical protein
MCNLQLTHLQNHDCRPNTYASLIHARGKIPVISLRAKSFIRAGEWITISYWGNSSGVCACYEVYPSFPSNLHTPRLSQNAWACMQYCVHAVDLNVRDLSGRKSSIIDTSYLIKLPNLFSA